MLILIFTVPFFAGLLTFLIRKPLITRTILILTAVLHFAAIVRLYFLRPWPVLANAWIALDDLGFLFLSVISFIFLLASIYCLGFLIAREKNKHFATYDERFFIGCILIFLATMSLVTVSQHFGLLWVAVEATTLASAPLICYHKSPRSLEATWKYLMICSLGIAIALLGTFCLAGAAAKNGDTIPLFVKDLVSGASNLNKQWLEIAFLMFLVGYGTKMGLAPVHMWLPDAYSEAPVTFAVLSGALANCAFLGILRIYQILVAAGNGIFAQNLLIFFGLLSMFIAGIFLVKQPDYKRMLAYSSIEHMGIQSLGIGVGLAAGFPTMMHVLNHSFTKAMLFFAAGTIYIAYESEFAANVRGAFRKTPFAAFCWIAGFLSITGMPPFGTFISKFSILGAALNQDKFVVSALYLVFLAVVFIGMARIMLRMTQGNPNFEKRWKESVFQVFPMIALFFIMLTLGIYMPDWLRNMLENSALLLKGGQ